MQNEYNVYNINDIIDKQTSLRKQAIEDFTKALIALSEIPIQAIAQPEVKEILLKVSQETLDNIGKLLFMTL